MDDSDPAVPTVCVELKPKCGFMVDGSTVHPAHGAKLTHTRFHLQQLAKVDSGSVERASNYSPPDMFSNDPLRLWAALNALVRDPQNNFRVFLDGRIAYGSGSPAHGVVALGTALAAGGGSESRGRRSCEPYGSSSSGSPPSCSASWRCRRRSAWTSRAPLRCSSAACGRSWDIRRRKAARRPGSRPALG
uniref:Inositol-pentakisphosphate 2-kinase n=1 Tax=Tetraselmis sp. GSL018 TaxID=582737 RepID=A0A061QJI7_9CHLO